MANLLKSQTYTIVSSGGDTAPVEAKVEYFVFGPFKYAVVTIPEFTTPSGKNYPAFKFETQRLVGASFELQSSSALEAARANFEALDVAVSFTSTAPPQSSTDPANTTSTTDDTPVNEVEDPERPKATGSYAVLNNNWKIKVFLSKNNKIAFISNEQGVNFDPPFYFPLDIKDEDLINMSLKVLNNNLNELKPTITTESSPPGSSAPSTTSGTITNSSNSVNTTNENEKTSTTGSPIPSTKPDSSPSRVATNPSQQGKKTEEKSSPKNGGIDLGLGILYLNSNSKAPLIVNFGGQQCGGQNNGVYMLTHFNKDIFSKYHVYISKKNIQDGKATVAYNEVINYLKTKNITPSSKTLYAFSAGYIATRDLFLSNETNVKEWNKILLVDIYINLDKKYVSFYSSFIKNTNVYYIYTSSGSGGGNLRLNKQAEYITAMGTRAKPEESTVHCKAYQTAVKYL